MLMRLSHDIGLYFYDVVVARFDLWAAFGVLAQFVFGARFIVQWIASEKAERSVVPVGFWYLSIAGGLMTLIYGLARRDIVIIMPQALSIFIYVRNLMLISKETKARKAKARAEAEMAGMEG
ncbi:MAG TPA: lipid-A-disaccharide synthase N-terminal domain-containing protein [Microvirga sp.]|nr:lipid-A-disaccharide synthase N-terminal domain-containing protein [Microvirga sp.]